MKGRLHRNPATGEKLAKILRDFIKEEGDAFVQYSNLALLLEKYGFTENIIRRVIEIAKQEEDHFYILSEILEAIG